MNRPNRGTRRTAAAAAVLLLLLAGGLLGVVVDRVWLLPAGHRGAEAMPLTVDALVARLDLSPSEEARMRALLDSMHTELAAAARHGSDSLHSAGRNAHQRLEAALPAPARAEFRAWIEEHHRQMLERMGGVPMHGRESTGREGTGSNNDSS